MTTPLDPAAVIAEFIDRVSPYNPTPDADPVAVLGVRTAFGEDVFTVSDHVIRAMCRALESYRDPEDRGNCAKCGGLHLDENLHCRDCGQLHGILGQVIAEHARRVAADSGPSPSSSSDDPHR
ncbi:hypothetical protein FHR83_008611 [Actinoplanes campanulatus]|uniref:Uncharacterized protein n=1 Tax=Actinoplanes campanulatus TaxID=113559 RepID=A0A7W5FJU4_9ACTN|nr:hypothetical protein [Actinoplanes campanulatus]MBB3100885.1 hypothetical protein [Actinoplanes campanulatus]